MPERIETWRSQPMMREARVESFARAKEGGNPEITLSLSSEYQVERWFGMEVLSHEPGAVRLNRMNNGAPLLLNHDFDQQVGAFKPGSVTIGEDRVMRGTAKLSRSAKATEIYADVEDDIRVNTSVAYRVYQYERAVELEDHTDLNDEGEPKKRVYRATDWEPIEGSLVAAGADPSVGKGRMIEKENTIRVVERDIEPETLREEVPTLPEITINEPDPQALKAAREQAQTEERQRQAEIRAIGERFKLKPEVVQAALDSGKSLDAFRQELINDFKPELLRAHTPEDTGLGLTPKERKRFNLSRAMLAMIDKDWSKAGFEREVSEAARQQSEKIGIVDPGAGRSLCLPMEIRDDMVAQASGKRDLLALTGEGPEFVGTEHRGGEFIELLRNQTQVINAGARVLTGLVGNIAVPRMTGGASGTWSATETAAYAEQTQAFDTLSLAPKQVQGFTEVSRLLLQQSDPSVDAIVREDLTLALGEAIDYAALEGAGTTEPEGIANATGVGSVNFGEISATWAKVLEAEADIGTANALRGRMGWILNWNTISAWKGTEKATGYPVYLYGDGDRPVNGYPVYPSMQAPNNTGTGSAFSVGYFGNWQELWIGMWGGLFLLVDPYTVATTNLVRIIVWQAADVGLRHPASFTYATGIKNTP